MNQFNKLLEIAKPYYANNDDPSHDFAHISRVMASCRKLGEELNADLEVLMPAALLHDVVNIPKLASEITGIDKSEVMYQSLKNPSIIALSKCPIPNEDKIITRNGTLLI